MAARMASWEGHRNVPLAPRYLAYSCSAFGLCCSGIISTRLAQKCRYVTLLQYFVIITLTWINLPDEQEPDEGGGICILKFYFVLLAWINKKVLEYRVVA